MNKWDYSSEKDLILQGHIHEFKGEGGFQVFVRGARAPFQITENFKKKKVNFFCFLLPTPKIRQ